MNLRRRARHVAEYFDRIATFDEDARNRNLCESTILKNFQHIRRGALHEALEIIEEAKRHPLIRTSSTVILDSIIQRMRKL